MSLKQEIETWVTALARYDNNEFDDSLGEFDKIADTSKILFNMGVIHATLGEHEKAVECYQRAIRLDQYLAVAYFQQGVSNFLLGDFEEALANFNDTLLYLRGNTMIDYAQLGLLFKLYSCEVLFNRGLCYIYLQQKDAGMQDLSYAVKEKVVEDHNVIDEAIKEEAEGYTVFSIPVGVVYRPNEAKVRNLKRKDYLGKARLVAASDRANAFTGFAGSEMKTQQRQAVKDDRPADNISYAATNLIKPGIQSRSTDNSRNVFPPTPPPDNDRASGGSGNGNASGQMTRGQSVRNGPKPQLAKLNIDTSGGNNRYEKTSSPPKRRPINATRSASSTPARGYSRRDQQRRYHTGRRRRMVMPIPTSCTICTREGRSSRGPSRRPQQQQRYIEEEDEGSEYDDGSFDEGDFEMVSNTHLGAWAPTQHRQAAVGRHGGPMSERSALRFTLRMIRDKFGLRRRFKITVRDDDGGPNGDMITMGDQDDLEMVIMSSKAIARRTGQEIGKMEIWIQEL
ncbi:neutrophil cytosol factor 2 [Verticillium alfalfae VaMs.102]|uniref:Neutrophil cytosol factor 2 n=1 Tax=Verticillium alfalfae (strain VaMs.102 / ATCC MYA-4576 / FGSC 10136) TaxID=526221 RepID=C9SP18_VERA1|nr:neutrophil cytosol factor 2 [Verticillium alfalfae VaMs.102]EEY20533.1 neutrophil cytosol factor 2 [Verticillium alfalfae VaMs.102]